MKLQIAAADHRQRLKRLLAVAGRSASEMEALREPADLHAVQLTQLEEGAALPAAAEKKLAFSDEGHPEYGQIVGSVQLRRSGSGDYRLRIVVYRGEFHLL